MSFTAPRDAASTNWSSGLTLWDRLHGAHRANHLVRPIIIGDPELRGASELRAASMPGLPFRPGASRQGEDRA